MTGRPFKGVTIWQGPPAKWLRVLAEVVPPGRGIWIGTEAVGTSWGARWKLEGNPDTVAHAIRALAFKPAPDLTGTDKLHFMLYGEAILPSGAIQRFTTGASRRIVRASSLVASTSGDMQASPGRLPFGDLPAIVRLSLPASSDALADEDLVFDDGEGTFVPLGRGS